MKICMPAQYIQDKGALAKIPEYFEGMVREGVFIVMDAFAYKNFKQVVEQSFKQKGIQYIIEVFEGECCKQKIDEIDAESVACAMDCIIGIGGGKVLDLVKVVGQQEKINRIIVPTSASTDGACSKIAVLYDKAGEFENYLYLDKSPEAVLVDTEIIAKAPVRLLKAGIGDALSTYFETEAGYKREIEKWGSSKMPAMARVISEKCLEVILNEGELAIQAVERQEVDRHLEAVIEGIIYLSCVGFEKGSLAAAHSIANVLSSNNKYNQWMHGEKVAFGTMVQIILEDMPKERIIEIKEFCKRIGLPYRLEQIGVTEEEVDEIAKQICGKDQPIHQMRSIFISPYLIKEALLSTNKL